MSAPPYMPLYVADYLSDTRHLTTEQHGAYLLLIMAMWRGGGRLKNDPTKLARMVGMTPARWSRVADEILSFFEDDGDTLTHRRITKEIEKYSRTSEARAQSGARGGAAKALKTHEKDVANATILPQQNDGKNLAYQISDIRVVEEANASLSPAGDAKAKYHPDFEQAWKAYPHVKGRSSKPKAYGQWRRIPTETRSRLPVAIERYKAKGREPNGECGAAAMERWLRDSRFLDWLDDEAEDSAARREPFPEPQIRAEVVTVKGEDWTASWLDPCVWDAEHRTIIPRTGFAAQRLRADVGRLLQAQNIEIQSHAA